MSIISKILIGFISLVFLFSTTGLLLVHHVCDTCAISEILINSDHKHKADHSDESCCTESPNTAESSCHSEAGQNIDDTECCKEDAFYLKITEPFLSYSYTVDVNAKVFQLFTYKLIEYTDFEYTDQLYYTSLLKPPDLSGRNILRNYCILRV